MISAESCPCWSSRPQTRKMPGSPRSVSRALLEAGEIITMPFSA
jgi:hypothetical protein